MAKTDITLEPSKGVISEMAAHIYSAYIIRGEMNAGEEDQFMERSIREALRIAKTVDRSVETEDASTGRVDAPDSTGETPSPRAPTTYATQPPPSGEPSAKKSELDAVIDEALAGQDVPARKLKQ